MLAVGFRSNPIRNRVTTQFSLQYRSYCVLVSLSGYGQKYRQRCTRRYSPACRRRSRTSRQSSPATQPSCTCAAHACATRLHKHPPRPAHSERLCGTCTHATTKLGSASRGHGRPACTQEARRWPISAWPWPGRHVDLELAADVAVAETGVPAAAQRVDGCSSQLDSCIAVDRPAARLQSPSRGVAAPPREGYIRSRRYF